MGGWWGVVGGCLVVYFLFLFPIPIPIPLPLPFIAPSLHYFLFLFPISISYFLFPLTAAAAAAATAVAADLSPFRLWIENSAIIKALYSCILSMEKASRLTTLLPKKFKTTMPIVYNLCGFRYLRVWVSE